MAVDDWIVPQSSPKAQPKTGEHDDWITPSAAAPEEPTFASGVGTGLLDKLFYGPAQLGAHVAAVPEQALVGDFGMVSPETQKTVDKAIETRERQLEREGYNEGWGRTVGQLGGDVVMTAPLSLIPGGPLVSALGRAGSGAAMGGAGGLLSALTAPVTEGNYETEKLKQAGIGLGTGAAGGGAFGIGEKALSSSLLPRAPVAKTPKEAESLVRSLYYRAIKPPVGIGKSIQDVKGYDKAVQQSLSTIIENKPALRYADTAGETIGASPDSLMQFADAISQTKEEIFQKYNSMTQAAETATTSAPLYKHFGPAFEEAQRSVAFAQGKVREAETAANLAAAKQSSARNNVYRTAVANQERREAEQQIKLWRDTVAKNERGRDRAYAQLYSVAVDLDPISDELTKLAGSKVVRTQHPELSNYADAAAKRYYDAGTYTPLEAQQAITSLNQSLKAFYNNPTFETAARANIDAMIANHLRKGLDEAIEHNVAPGYQALKNTYGALKDVEKHVTHRAIVEARKNAGGGLLGNIGDVLSAEEIIRGIATMRPAAVATGMGVKGVTAALRQLRDPNYTVRRIFRTVERPTTTSPISPRFAAPVGATSSALSRAILGY